MASDPVPGRNDLPDADNLARARLAAALQRLGKGERAALGDVYRATSAKLFGIVLRISKDRNVAEDVLQDVYLGLVRSAHRFDPARASPITWLAVIARNRAIDRMRRARIATGAVPVEAAQTIAGDTPLADAVIEQAQDDARIHRCIEELARDQRDAVRGAFLRGATYAELAEQAGVPLATMKSRVRRALGKLKGCLER